MGKKRELISLKTFFAPKKNVAPVRKSTCTDTVDGCEAQKKPLGN